MDHLHPFLGFLDVFLDGFLPKRIDGEIGEGWDGQFPTVKHHIGSLSSSGGGRSVVGHGDIIEVFRPRGSGFIKTRSQVIDKSAIPSFYVSLRLGPVDDRGPLFDAHQMRDRVDEIAAEFRPIIA